MEHVVNNPTLEDKKSLPPDVTELTVKSVSVGRTNVDGNTDHGAKKGNHPGYGSNSAHIIDGSDTTRLTDLGVHDEH